MNARWPIVLFVVAAVGVFPRQSPAQNSDDGPSYIHITIGDHVLTNFVGNQEYQKGDWLSVEEVLVKSTGQTHAAASATRRLPQDACAILTDQSALCWGANQDGDFGNGMNSVVTLPIARA